MNKLLENLDDSEIKAALALLKCSPEFLLKKLMQAYSKMQLAYNSEQQEVENPMFLNTIVKLDKQPLVDTGEAGIYQDEIFSVRLRSVYQPVDITAFSEAVRGIL